MDDQHLRTDLGAIGESGSDLLNKERQLLTTDQKRANIGETQVDLGDAYRQSLKDGTFTNLKNDPVARATAQARINLGLDAGENKQLNPADIPMTGDLAELSAKLGIGQNVIESMRKEKEAQLKSQGVSGVPQDLAAAYQRAQQAGKFEDVEAGQGKDARAMAQLKWEQTGAGIEWLQGQGFSSAGGTSGTGTSGVGTKDFLYKNSDEYRQLLAEAPDLAAIIDSSYLALFKGSEQDFTNLNAALKNAAQIVDPVYKGVLAMTRATLIDKIAKTTHGYDFGQKAVARIRDELLQDVATEGSFLELEEQAQLAKILRDLDQTSLSLRDTAAARGVTFGEGRFTLSEDLQTAGIESAEIIMSTKREANLQRARLENRAQAGDRTAREELQRLSAEQGFNLQDISREAEQLLGSNEAARLPLQEGGTPLVGTNFVSGVMGTIEQERQAAYAKEISDYFNLDRVDANLTANF